VKKGERALGGRYYGGEGRRVRMEQEKGWMGGAGGNKAREGSKKEGADGECYVLKKRGSQGREGRQEAE